MKSARKSQESFEVEFDSAEFDDLNMDEGHRPEYEHILLPNSNFIRELLVRSNSMPSIRSKVL